MEREVNKHSKNVTPKFRESKSSTHFVDVSKYQTKLKNRRLGFIKTPNKKVAFILNPVDDVHNKIKQQEYYDSAILHDNVRDLFDGNVQNLRPFLIQFYRDKDISKSHLTQCTEIDLYVEGDDSQVNSDELRNALKARELFHPGMEEVFNLNNRSLKFQTVDVTPNDFNFDTVLINSSTEINFVSEPPKNKSLSSDHSPADPDLDLDLEPETPKTTFDEVAGMDHIKKEANKIVELSKKDSKDDIRDYYGEEFASRGNGVLFYGPPGCGKTYVSNALAHKVMESLENKNVKFLEIKSGQILSKNPGKAQRRIEAIFNWAHEGTEDSFVILLLDEIETLVADRGSGNMQRFERDITNAFLKEMDPDDLEDDLLVIGITNYPNMIDPAADRRFPMQIFVEPPDQEVLAEVWKENLDPKNNEYIDDELEGSFDDLAKESKEFTPAEIANKILGAEMQTDLVLSYMNKDPKTIDIDYLKNRINQYEPDNIPKYINSIKNSDLDGYPKLKKWINEEVSKRRDYE